MKPADITAVAEYPRNVPLNIPQRLKPHGALSMLLQDMPVIGGISRRRREIFRQLTQRNDASLETWGQDKSKIHLVSELASIIQEHMGWPNIYYIPEDPCELLFCASTTGMQDVCALQAISLRYALPDDTLGDVYDLLFVQLVDRIFRSSGRPSGAR